MRNIMLVSMLALVMVAPTASGDMLDLSPIGAPSFTQSITQHSWMPATVVSSYIGIRVLNPGGAFIESVGGLGSLVAGTDQYNGNNRLVEAWWVNTSPPTFSSTLELESILGNQAAQQNPASYTGLTLQLATAAINGTISLSSQWVFTGRYWQVAGALGDGLWDGGSPAGIHPASAAVPAPGAVVLGMVGLGLVTRFRRWIA